MKVHTLTGLSLVAAFNATVTQSISALSSRSCDRILTSTCLRKSIDDDGAAAAPAAAAADDDAFAPVTLCCDNTPPSPLPPPPPPPPPIIIIPDPAVPAPPSIPNAGRCIIFSLSLSRAPLFFSRAFSSYWILNNSVSLWIRDEMASERCELSIKRGCGAL